MPQDIVVMASDGLFDNLEISEIISIISSWEEANRTEDYGDSSDEENDVDVGDDDGVDDEDNSGGYSDSEAMGEPSNEDNTIITTTTTTSSNSSHKSLVDTGTNTDQEELAGAQKDAASNSSYDQRCRALAKALVLAAREASLDKSKDRCVNVNV
jgi:hypothetical protein